MAFQDIQSFIGALRERRDLLEINEEVDPRLEIAEIHRRVIARGGPALLFTRVKGSSFPVVTNLFGTKARVDLAFGDEARRVIEEVAKLPHELLPPTLPKLWSKRSLFTKLARVGLKRDQLAKVSYGLEIPPDLEKLPILTSWSMDGGPFVTLPLVYTEDPESGISNLGMYRMQRFSKDTTGMHMQIGKGGGFHLSRADELGKLLPLNVFIGGPPAAIIAAIAPLPENVPELLLASLLIKQKLRPRQPAACSPDRCFGRCRHQRHTGAPGRVCGKNPAP